MNNKTMLTAAIIGFVIMWIAGYLTSTVAKTGKQAGEKIKVMATIFPVYDIAKTVAGDKGEITMLLPPGVEAHSYEPTPKNIIELKKSRLFIFTSEYMEPWAEKITAQVTDKTAVVDASKGITLLKHEEETEEEEHEESGYDPHIWLDPVRAKIMTDNIAAEFAKADPANKEFYLSNAQNHKAKLDELDRVIAGVVAKSRIKTIIYGGHFAFGYFAARYGLGHVSPYENFSPDSEPTPKNIETLVKTAKKLNVKYIFFEELINPKAAEVISKESGTQLLLLHGVHNVSKKEIEEGATYLKIMAENVENLKKGLDYSE